MHGDDEILRFAQNDKGGWKNDKGGRKNDKGGWIPACSGMTGPERSRQRQTPGFPLPDNKCRGQASRE